MTLKNIFRDIRLSPEVFEDEDTHENILLNRLNFGYYRTPSEAELQLGKNIVSFLLEYVDEMTEDELNEAVDACHDLDDGKLKEYRDMKFGKLMEDEECGDCEEEDDDYNYDDEDYFMDIIEGTISVHGKKEELDYLCSTIDELTEKYGTPGNECGLYLPINAMIETLHKGIPEFYEGNILSYERNDDKLEILAEGSPTTLADLIQEKFPDAKVTYKSSEF